MTIYKTYLTKFTNLTEYHHLCHAEIYQLHCALYTAGHPSDLRHRLQVIVIYYPTGSIVRNVWQTGGLV